MISISNHPVSLRVLLHSAAMRLIDFGCAKEAADDQIFDDLAGTPYYIAPEVPILRRTQIFVV